MTRAAVGDYAGDERGADPSHEVVHRGGWQRLHLGTGRFSDRGIWWSAFGLHAALFLLWSISMPLFSSPDEPAHVIKAAAVVRGQLLGADENTAAGATLTHVTVPAALAGKKPCFAHRPKVPASCAPAMTQSTKSIDATTLAGHYPPLYYALVGTGSLLVPGPNGLFAMRFLSSLLSAAFIASALVSSRRWPSGLGPLAVGLAATPMVLFIGAGVNPSGFEITAAACVWASGLSLLAPPSVADRRLVLRLGISASAMVLTRSLSPVWLAVIVIVVVLASGFGAVRSAFRRWDVRLCALGVFLATLAATAWIQLADALVLLPGRRRTPLSIPDAIGVSFERYPYRLKQMVGHFGWLDTPSPMWTWLAWAAAGGLVVVLCLSTAVRGRAALVMLIILVVALPILIEASQQKTLGFVWQGRYTLPIAVGIPLVAARLVDLASVRSSPLLTRRLASVSLLLLGSGQLAAFAWNLKRNTVGANAPLTRLEVAWEPPLPALLLLLLFAVAAGATAMLLRSAAEMPRVDDVTARHPIVTAKASTQPRRVARWTTPFKPRGKKTRSLPRRRKSLPSGYDG